MSAGEKSYGKRILATAAIYAAAAWAAVEALVTVVDRFGLPDEWAAFITALFVAGLPVTIYLVWRTAGKERRASFASIAGSLLALVAGTVWIYLMTLPDPLPRATAVAVVPCEFQGTPEYAYRAEGISEDVHARLSRVDSVKISSWNSSLFVFDRGYQPGEIADLLKVDRLVRCRMTSDAGRIVLSAELIDPVANTVLWNGEYDFASSDLGTVVTELAATLLDMLGTPAEAAELERVNDLGTFSSEAYDLFLRAQDAWQWPNNIMESLDQAELLVEQVLEIDPNYAEALVFRARIFFGRINNQEMSDLSILRGWELDARALLERALEIDRGILGARHGLAHICDQLGHYFNEPCPDGEANRLREEECEVRGDTAEGWACRHRLLADEDNYPALKRWLELEPTSFEGNAQAIAHIWFDDEDPAGALAQFDTLRALYPGDLRPPGLLSNLLRMEGRLDEVLAWRWGSFGDRVPEGSPWSLARLGTDYMNLGLYERALEVGLQTRESRRFSALHFVPELWAGMGEIQLAAKEWEWGASKLMEASGTLRSLLQQAVFMVDYLRDYQGAKQLFERMLAELEMGEICELDFECEMLLPLTLAQIERALGDEKRASDWLAVAEEMAGRGKLEGHAAVTMAIAQGRHAEAVQMLRETVFEWGDGSGDLPLRLHMLEYAALYDPLRGSPEFEQLLEDYRAALEPMRQRALEAGQSGDWEALRQNTYRWVESLDA